MLMRILYQIQRLFTRYLMRKNKVNSTKISILFKYVI